MINIQYTPTREELQDTLYLIDRLEIIGDNAKEANQYNWTENEGEWFMKLDYTEQAWLTKLLKMVLGEESE